MFSRSCWGWLHTLKTSTLRTFYKALATDDSETAMAPKKKPGRKPAPKEPNQAGKKSNNVAKKTPPYKPVAKTPTAIKKETKTKATKSTSKSDPVVEDENISEKPLGHTRAATRRAAEEEPTKSTGSTLTITTTTKKSQGKPAKSAGTKSAATKEPSPEPVHISSKNDTLPASPKRKRTTEDKWTDTTDLPRPKSPKLHEGSSPSPSRKDREIRPLGESDSEGWDTRDFDRNLCCTDAVELSRIPSPFADLRDRADRLMHIVDNHAHSWVQDLFHRVRDRDYSSRIISGLGTGSHGVFGVLQFGTKDHVDVLEVPSDRPKFSLGFKNKEGTTTGVSLDVQVCKNAKTDEIDYFIINKDCDLFIINDRHVGRRLAAGPLPDFAVILTDRWVMFWWRSRAAMDYVPRAVSEDTQEVEEEGTTKEPSPPPRSAKKGGDNTENPSSPSTNSSDRGKDTNQRAEPLETWEDILNQKLAHYSSSPDRLNYKPHKIPGYDGMDLEDVLLAVATIWDALRNIGTYAFVGEEHLNPGYREAIKDGSFVPLGVGVVGGVNGRFIMPLGFLPNQEKQEKQFKKKNQAKIQKQKTAKAKDKKEGKNVSGPLGHILLAVAKRGSPETNQVDIEIRDSLPGCEKPDHIKETAQRLAATWLGMKEVNPNFADVKVVKQPKRISACGLFTILNAWAVMLGIPLLEKLKRSDHRDGNDTEFLERALDIVNLALAGCMDSRTIQAFLNVYGYSTKQDVHDLPEHTVNAVRMDPRRLERSLEHQKEKDENIPSLTPSPSSSQGSTHSHSSAAVQKALFDSEVDRTLAQVPGLSREQAENLVQNLQSESKR